MRDVELEAGEVPPPGDPERIISGAYEALDREYITNKFVGQNGARNLRDGLGFPEVGRFILRRHQRRRADQHVDYSASSNLTFLVALTTAGGGSPSRLCV